MRFRRLGICVFIGLFAFLLMGGSFVNLGFAYFQNSQQVIDRNQNHEPKRWYGVAPIEVDKLIENLGGLVDKHPDLFSGVALSYDRQKVNLFLVNPGNIEKVPEVKALVESNRSLLDIKVVRHTIKDLQETRDKAVGALEGKGLLAASINVVDNSIDLGVETNSKAHVLALSLSRTAENGEKLFKITEIKSANNTGGRYADYSRFFMGGSIVGSSGSCSYVGSTIGNDQVSAHGIVKGFYTDVSGNSRYTFTQFSGAQAWKANLKLDR